jgi:hypothetical protein
MYRLSILDLDLNILQYSGNPYDDTLPELVTKLAEILSSPQSYGTILHSINHYGSYARGALDQHGLPCVAIIIRLPM